MLLDTGVSHVVQYKYNAWGCFKVLDASGAEITDTPHIGYKNPIRYRGYYYNAMLGLYYLTTRYYDPETCRFTSADSIDYLASDTVNGLNLYAYCANNPVMNVDLVGTSAIGILIFLGIAAILGGVGLGAKAYTQGARGWELAKSIIGGFGLGLAAGGAIIALGAVFAGATALIAGTGAANVFGVAASQAFAIGALAVDFWAFIIAPLLGIEAQGIEYEAYNHAGNPTLPQYLHPALNKR